MKISEAKQSLKKHGKLDYRGVQFFETTKMVGNWQKYTGKYIVKVAGELITAESVSLSQAFTIAKKYFQ